MKDKAGPGIYSRNADQQLIKEGTHSLVTISNNLTVHTSHSPRTKGKKLPSFAHLDLTLPIHHIKLVQEYSPWLLRPSPTVAVCVGGGGLPGE